MNKPLTLLSLRLGFLIFFISAFFISPGVHAENETEADPDSPDTLVLSDTLDYDDKQRESIFTGNVILNRRTINMHADTLVMTDDEQGFQYGVATIYNSDMVLVSHGCPYKTT